MQIQINTCERIMTFAHVMESVLTQKKLLQEVRTLTDSQSLISHWVLLHQLEFFNNTKTKIKTDGRQNQTSNFKMTWKVTLQITQKTFFLSPTTQDCKGKKFIWESTVTFFILSSFFRHPFSAFVTGISKAAVSNRWFSHHSSSHRSL